MDRWRSRLGRRRHFQPHPHRHERAAKGLLGYWNVPNPLQQDCNMHHLLLVRSAVTRLRTVGRFLVLRRSCAWPLRR